MKLKAVTPARQTSQKREAEKRSWRTHDPWSINIAGNTLV
jgi:hypothetical protein